MMVTIVDPTGTPAPVYTLSGVTIQNISPAQTTSLSVTADYTQLVAECGHTIIVSNQTAAVPYGVLLPVGAEVGDLVEVHSQGAANVYVAAPVGESIGDGASTTSTTVLSNIQVEHDNGRQFRKTSSSNWKAMG